MPSPHSRSPAQRLADIRDNIDAALAFVEGQSLEQFVADQKTVYAVVRALEIISEASRHVPDAIKQRFPETQWRAIADSGNVFRHVYESVSLRIVWQTVQGDLLPLREIVVAALTQVEPD